MSCGVAVLVLAALAVTGCEKSREGSSGGENERRADQIASSLERTGRFTYVHVAYLDDASHAQEVGVELRCEGCDPARELDGAVRRVWQSRIGPITVISATVLDTAGPRTRTFDAVLPEDEAEMVEKYGERPAR